MKNLSGKVALVTGGNSGIGYATARLLKEKGAEVIITGRRKAAVEAAANELGVKGLVADQASIKDAAALAEAVKDQFGRLDILFINAGVVKPFMIEQAEEEVFDEVMGINFKGAYFTLSKLIPVLNAGASVIFLSSIVSRIQSPGSSIYSASKAALNAVMRTAALELAPQGIRVNAVSPGPVNTAIMGKAGIEETTLKVVMDNVRSKIPAGRMGDAEEIAELVLFLAGDKARFITGAEFTIDGGLTLQ